MLLMLMMLMVVVVMNYNDICKNFTCITSDATAAASWVDIHSRSRRRRV